MKSCEMCKHAIWDTTKAGRLHPSGNGRCGKIISLPQLPPVYYWLDLTRLGGGTINRRDELREHCVYWAMQ